MAILQQILHKVKIISVKGIPVNEINELQIDSRKIKPGDCFIAVKGTTTDGHTFINTAISNGATVIICQSLPGELEKDIQYIEVQSSAEAAGVTAHNYYGQLTEKIKLIGVTGTNGKTTIATLLFQLFSSIGYKCGLLSTVHNQISEKILPATHTTPDPISLNILKIGRAHV